MPFIFNTALTATLKGKLATIKIPKHQKAEIVHISQTFAAEAIVPRTPDNNLDEYLFILGVYTWPHMKDASSYKIYFGRRKHIAITTFTCIRFGVFVYENNKLADHYILNSEDVKALEASHSDSWLAKFL